MKDKKSNIILSLLTLIFILIICIGVTVLLAIKPYNKISTYLNLAFMDNLKTVPDSSGVLSGLNITENEISTDYDAIFSDTGDVVRPSFGEQFAVLSSDKFELTIPVYWGTNSELFQRGACQSSNSVLSGLFGNAVISAHVNTFFSELYKLEVGDTVEISTSYGIFTYEVTEQISFDKNDKQYVTPKNEEILTLYTCKSDVLGSSDERTGVVCKIIDKKFYVQTED